MRSAVQEAIGKSVVIGQSENYHVHLRFHQKLRRDIQGHTFSKNQKIIENQDGTTELKFSTTSLMETFWWILGWGHGVTVLAPDELITLHRIEIKKMSELYDNPIPEYSKPQLDKLYSETELKH